MQYTIMKNLNICCQYMNYENIFLKYLNYETWKYLFAIHEYENRNILFCNTLWKFLCAKHEFWNMKIFVCNTWIMNIFVGITLIMKKQISALHELWKLKMFICSTWIMKIFVCNARIMKMSIWNTQIYEIGKYLFVINELWKN